VTTDQQLSEVEPFTPVQPVTRRRMIVRVVVSPLIWLIAFVVAAIVVRRTDAIAVGLAIGLASMVAALIGLSLIRAARDRDRRRYAERA
jgi:hypothetical protein